MIMLKGLEHRAYPVVDEEEWFSGNLRYSLVY